MKFATDSELYELFPSARIGVLYLKDIIERGDRDTDIIAHLKQNVLDRIAARTLPITKTDNYRKWQHVTQTLGLEGSVLPSHLALLKRIQAKGNLPDIHPIVDSYNHLSALRQIPVGGHDVTGVESVAVGLTQGNETFKVMNTDTEEQVGKGEWAYLNRERKQVLTRNLVWRQSEYSKISDTPSELLIPLDDFVNAYSDDQLAGIAQELVEILATQYEFSWDFGVVSKHNNVKAFNTKKINISSKPNSLLLPSPKIDTSAESIEKFFDHRIDQVYPSADELKEALASGKRLSFYIGADATGPRLHLGHLIPVLKLKQLQQMGHRLIFLIGDFTARIGDPTDKTAARVMLSRQDVEDNAQRFKAQIARYIDFEDDTNPAELVFNSEWNTSLDMADVINLGARFTVQQMLERDMFQVRLKENKPIYLHEFFYPMLQGYDSVFMEVSGEFGGRDQTFNMLAGRDLERSMKGINKFVITTHFLLAADGTNKMSKSIGNCIFIEDTPEDKYGKVMSIPDELIKHYYEYATLLSKEEITSKLDQDIEPIGLKKQLAFEVTRLNDGPEAAQQAQKHFETTVQNDELPEDIKTLERKAIEAKIGANSTTLKELLTISGLTQSNSYAKRLIKGGGVEVNEQKITDPNAEYPIADVDLLKAGKRNWLKLID